jgi:hypothetical protein
MRARSCEPAIRAVKKAQRINRGELGELTVGHMAALTHDFLGQALELWQKVSPGIIIDCVGEWTQKRKNARCWMGASQ